MASLADEPYEDVLQTAAGLVRELRPAELVNTVEGVAVGFDDGDLEIVWTKDRSS